jgi:hypothetical protein
MKIWGTLREVGLWKNDNENYATGGAGPKVPLKSAVKVRKNQNLTGYNIQNLFF